MKRRIMEDIRLPYTILAPGDISLTKEPVDSGYEIFLIYVIGCHEKQEAELLYL